MLRAAFQLKTSRIVISTTGSSWAAAGTGSGWSYFLSRYVEDKLGFRGQSQNKQIRTAACSVSFDYTNAEKTTQHTMGFLPPSRTWWSATVSSSMKKNFKKPKDLTHTWAKVLGNYRGRCRKCSNLWTLFVHELPSLYRPGEHENGLSLTKKYKLIFCNYTANVTFLPTHRASTTIFRLQPVQENWKSD